MRYTRRGGAGLAWPGMAGKGMFVYVDRRHVPFLYREAIMSEKLYRVGYTRGDNLSVITAPVRASSASQAKEQIKARERGKAKIIAAVEG